MKESTRRLFYDNARRIVLPFIYTLWKPRVSGLENIPKEGAFVVASNHLANVDSFVIPVVAPRRIHFLVKSTYWENPSLADRFMQIFFDLVGAVPVDRGTLHSAQGSLQVALEHLQRGEAFGIYPEGTRSRDGKLYKGRAGAAWLALEADVPIIPVGLRGTQHFWPSGSKWPVRHPFTVRFGKPIYPSQISPDAPKARRRREITDLLMDEIAALSGQQRVDKLNTPPQGK